MTDSIFNSKYKFIRELGKGGCGTVFLAENVMLGNIWAVKQIPKDRETSISAHIEPQVLKRLNHPALPRICDVYDEQEAVYIVEDYIEGDTLKQILDNHGALQPERVLSIGFQLLNVLNYLHRLEPQPVIYRDMKPHNIIITKEDYIKLVDFGVSVVLTEKNMCSETAFIGTRGYAAPEVYSGQSADFTSDIYSFGITIFVLLTAARPEAISQIHKEIPNSITNLIKHDTRHSSNIHKDNHLAQDILNIIRKCTQYNKEFRYQSIEEVITAFREIEQFHMAKKNHTAPLSASKSEIGRPNIIGVWGVSGTGISTVAYAMCELAVKQGYETCYLDLSLNSRMQLSSNITGKAPTAHSSATYKKEQKELVTEPKLIRAPDGFDYVTFNTLIDFGQAENESDLQKASILAKQLSLLRSKYTLIIVDCSLQALKLVRQYIYYEIIVSDMNPYNIIQLRDNITIESLSVLVINKYYYEYLSLPNLQQMLGNEVISNKAISIPCKAISIPCNEISITCKAISIPYEKEIYLGMCRSYIGECSNILKVKNSLLQQSLWDIWSIVMCTKQKKSFVARLFGQQDR